MIRKIKVLGIGVSYSRDLTVGVGMIDLLKICQTCASVTLLPRHVSNIGVMMQELTHCGHEMPYNFIDLESALVKLMVWNMSDTKPLPELGLASCQLDP